MGRRLAVAAAACLAAMLSWPRADAASCPAQAAREAGPPIAFPADAGTVDVAAFGAVPDDGKDDSTAILRAIAHARDTTDYARLYPPLVTFGAGTYLVSRPIEKREKNGDWASGLILQGAGRDLTTLRLADGAPGYGDPAAPRGVIFTASHLWNQGGATAGGKDWKALGEGNQAFQNTIRNMTIDVGRGNPGAVGIDYLANNSGAIRSVRIVSADRAGAVGIAMTRKWPGPALLQDVAIDGFSIGVALAWRDYSVTLDGISVTHAKVALRNDGNVAAIGSMHASDVGRVFENPQANGLIAASDVSYERVADAWLADNAGTVAVFAAEGGGKPVCGKRPPLGVHAASGPVRGPGRTRLPVPAPTPPPLDEPLAEWRSITAFGGRGNDDRPDTDALRAALASGARTVYLPYGAYVVDGPVDVPPTVERIVGLNSAIVFRRTRGPAYLRTTGAGGAALRIEDLRLRIEQGASSEGAVAILHAAPRPLALVDVMDHGREGAIERAATGGALHLDNYCCARLEIAGEAPVFARQFNSEGGGVRLMARQAPVTILGLKAEEPNTLIEAADGAQVSVLGGLVYPLRKVPQDRPLTVLDRGEIFALLAASRNGGDDYYTLVTRRLDTSGAGPKNVTAPFGRIVLIDGNGF